MRDDPSVIALVARVGDGDQEAWNELVERYAPLVWSICVRYGLSRQDTDDVGQSVWLLLVEQIGKLRSRRRCPAGWRRRPGVNVCGFCGQGGGMTTTACPRMTRCRLTRQPR